MLSTDQFMDIALLHREGRSLREIAALTGHSRNTIRRVVREKVPTPFHTPPRPSRLDPFKGLPAWPFPRPRAFRRAALCRSPLHRL